ncbi:MAG: flagellar motor switch protein FliN [Alphaproteobacteria bacterium]
MSTDNTQTDDKAEDTYEAVASSHTQPSGFNGSGPGTGSAKPTAAAPELEEGRLQALHAVPVDLQVVLGHAALPVAQLLKLSRGAVVEIDRKVGECVDIHVNSHLVARGEVVILDDNKLGITLTDITSTPSLAGLSGRPA